MAQVSGNKVGTIQPSKNLGTVIDNQVSGNKVEAYLKYKKLTEVKNTQVAGENILTNYMGINKAGMNIFVTKKISKTDESLGKYDTAHIAKETYIEDANTLIAKQEADKKKKEHLGPDIKDITVTLVEGLKEGDPKVASGANIATLSAVGGVSPIVYGFYNDEVNGIDNTKFVIETTNLKVGTEALTEGTYKVSILATDKNNKTFIKNVLITVAAAE